MKKIITIFLHLALWCAVVSAQPGRIVTDTVKSEILGQSKPFSVYLPARYDDSTRDYPVLYLLHGAWDDYRSWPDKGNVRHIADMTFNSGMAVEAIIVMPDASGENPDRTGYRMGYFDKPDWEYERHFFEEFIPFVENKYRIRGEKRYRAVAGLSMGGGGSMVYALHRPDMFGSCAPLSGLLTGYRAPSLPTIGDDFLDSIARNDPQQIIREADEQTLEDFRRVRWYIDCGDDDFLAEYNVQVFLLMKDKNIPLQYRMRDGGHTWDYWQSALPSVLQFISTGFSQ